MPTPKPDYKAMATTIYEAYPKRQGNARTRTVDLIIKALKDGIEYDYLLMCTRHYAATRENEDPTYTKMSTSFFAYGKCLWEGWENPPTAYVPPDEVEYHDPSAAPVKVTAETKRWLPASEEQ